MDLHYNAFISYRHHPDDIRVASEVHRALERFKVPRSIKKKAKNKGALHLFRDKEELPITSNLNDDIGDALRNSDYLIVICSVHTKESIWVQREIELFLKSHDRNRVLTVLASGEPYDVIPEILLYDDVVDPITGETTRTLVEPLSCDWRMKRKKAIREELPRLAAPLLFCSYDELRQRQRQYRMRRLITFFSIALVASLGLAAYFLQTSITIQRKNVEIQANLEQSQRNQSKHLASASAERLTEGDRLTAISLAVAALPDETGNRPYVPEAERALTEALGIYQQNLQTLAVGAVTPGGQIAIRKFWADPSGSLLYLQDERKHITVWDTATMAKIGEWDYSQGTLDTLIPIGDGLVLVKYGTDAIDALKCVNTDGISLWEVENCIDVIVTETANSALIIAKKDLTSYELLFLDVKTGNALQPAVDLNVLGMLNNPSKFFTRSITEGSSVLIRYSDIATQTVCSFPWGSGEHRVLDLPSAFAPYSVYTNDGNVVTMSYSESDAFTGVFEGNRVNATVRSQICCVDPVEGSLLWQAELASSVSGSASLNRIPESDLILCQAGPVFQVLDAATGETVARCEAGSSAVSVSVGKDYAHAVLEDGYQCNYWYYENYCYEAKCMQSGQEQVFICPDGGQELGIYRDYFSLQRDARQVTVYRRTEPEVLWRLRPEYLLRLLDQRVYDNQWVFADYENMYLIDAQTGQFRWTLALPYSILLGFSGDGATFWTASYDGYVYAVDTASGEIAAEQLSIPEGSYLDYGFLEETVFCAVSGREQAVAISRNLRTGETNQWDLPAGTDPEQQMVYDVVEQNDQYLWLWSDDGTLWGLDTTSGEYHKLAEELMQCPVIAVDETGTYMAITAGDKVLTMAPGAQEQQTIQLEEVNAASLYYHGNELLVLCDNGYLFRYDVDGNLLSRTALTVGEGFSQDVLAEATTQTLVSWQQTADRKLIVNCFAYGNVVDCENWTVSTVVPAYNFYWEANKSFVCDTDSGFAAYPRYTVPELLQLAGEELGTFRLTEDQKAGYGLE